MSTVHTAKMDIGTSANIEPFLNTVYERYRDSLVKVKYSGYKLKWAKRLNLYAEIVVAISTASGVSGWAIWDTPGGKPLWSFIAGAAALIAAVKPLLPLSDNISTYSKLHSGYVGNYLGLKGLVESIAHEQGFSRQMEKEFEDLKKRYRDLVASESLSEPDPSRTLRQRFESEVDAEITRNSLWYPAK